MPRHVPPGGIVSAQDNALAIMLGTKKLFPTVFGPGIFVSEQGERERGAPSAPGVTPRERGPYLVATRRGQIAKCESVLARSGSSAEGGVLLRVGSGWPGSAGNSIGSTYIMPSFAFAALGSASCSRFAIWRARRRHSGQECIIIMSVFRHSAAASPENPIAVARKHARQKEDRRPRQGAAGAHERIVLPLKIFVGDGIGLKILFADLLLSQPITRRSSLAKRA